MRELVKIQEFYKLIILILLSVVFSVVVTTVLALFSFYFYHEHISISIFNNQIFGLITLFLNQSFMFLIPSLIFWKLFQSNEYNYIHFNKLKVKNLVYCFVIIISIQLLAPIIVEITKKIIEFLGYLEKAELIMEEQTLILEKLLINKKGVGDLFLLKLFVLAIVPAICEEFIFRGILLSIFQRWFNSKNIAILSSSLLFSIIHFQPFNALVFLLIGIVFGWIYYKYKNIWLTVFMHFVFNASSLILYEFFNITFE